MIKHRYSVDLFCKGLPPEGCLVKDLEYLKRGFYATPSKDLYIENSAVYAGEVLDLADEHQEEIRQCSKAYISVAFFPDCLIADCSLVLPSTILKRMSSYGIGLQVAIYPPPGKEQIRYGGRAYFLVASTEEDIESPDNVPLSVRRSLRERGLFPLKCAEYSKRMSVFSTEDELEKLNLAEN